MTDTGPAGTTSPPVNVAQQLDVCERELAEATMAKSKAYQAWKLAEAKERLKLRAIDESAGTRWATQDVAAAVIVMRNDPNHEVGKLWLAYVSARTRAVKLNANHEILVRANYAAIRAGRFGA